MLRKLRASGIALLATAALVMLLAPRRALADSADQIDSAVAAALQSLYNTQPEAKAIGAKATAILVFPQVYKAGFMFGGQYGEGALLEHGDTVGYYATVAASYGFQAGVQSFGYVMFFMNKKALNYLNQSGGFEIGVGPSIVVVDQGMAKSMTTMTLTQDVYAFIFNQKGLMGGAGIQGSKITKINRMW